MYQWLPQQPVPHFLHRHGYCGAGLCAALLSVCFVVGYGGLTFGIRVGSGHPPDLFTHMQDLGFDFYDRNRTGQLMSRITSDLFDLTELAHHGPEDTVTSCQSPLWAPW